MIRFVISETSVHLRHYGQIRHTFSENTLEYSVTPGIPLLTRIAAKIIALVLPTIVTGIIAPKVSYRFDNPQEGGVTQVDLRTIKDTFTLAGARRVEHESVQPTSSQNR